MDVTPPRDAFGRPVPDCQVTHFRKRPYAVCPLCDGQGHRLAERARRICSLCDGWGHLDEAKVMSLNADLLAICKGYSAAIPPPDPIPHPVTPKPSKRKPQETLAL
jgi:hypothetical protein